MVKVVKLIVWDTKGSLVILLYYGYLHMIEFNEFDDLHDSHSVGMQERRVYLHMVIIIRKVRDDLFIRVRLSYNMGPRGSLGVTNVLWYHFIANRNEPRESHLKELRISLALSLGVKSSICNFTSWDEVKL